MPILGALPLQRVQTLAGISRSALSCHNNETREPLANPTNSAQLQGIITIPQVTSGSVQVMWECGEGQSDTQTHRRAWPIYISRGLRLMLYVTSHRAGKSTRWHFAFGAIRICSV